jgi:hypothetical protein
VSDEHATCATCRFFDPVKALAGSTPTNGLCRVSAPTVNASKPWPVVRQTDWCGEHPTFSSDAKAPVIPA